MAIVETFFNYYVLVFVADLAALALTVGTDDLGLRDHAVAHLTLLQQHALRGLGNENGRLGEPKAGQSVQT